MTSQRKMIRRAAALARFPTAVKPDGKRTEEQRKEEHDRIQLLCDQDHGMIRR